jgi:hypothetical protein
VLLLLLVTPDDDEKAFFETTWACSETTKLSRRIAVKAYRFQSDVFVCLRGPNNAIINQPRDRSYFGWLYRRRTTTAHTNHRNYKMTNGIPEKRTAINRAGPGVP